MDQNPWKAQITIYDLRTENLSNPITYFKNWICKQKPSQKENPIPDGFTDAFHQTFKKSYTIFCK